MRCSYLTDFPKNAARAKAQWLTSEVAYAVRLLRKAHSSYIPGKPLGEQTREIHDTVLIAFNTLRKCGILPATLGNVLIHHLSMVRFIAICMPSYKTAVQYLRDPSVLVRALNHG
ncbi:hypothetical protein A3H10_05205 [Candidatus Uhrbacteria bacterium RIFCSPLOWO2_12_FULL_46_10]|uniref:Uncharacterized protein n=1 Tax=Candidatus Uhrbacteria bacterium RIFCSPLOWO2_01_FULL_47_25 TaxID=1802402 RepID=A0A1F7UT22_9BACT|nr:MAG: hypothetical protein A3D60_05345 [Candidatus Uhrbacteria bacterium RIFCSPHIGHO2_02_FULL_47_29]OGL81453.1 MAG: hypothetical protein A2936_00005 [Candidatus Uhrbacteria bacterium RIFCSPLOWO2_01_FULL_47_25]OGL85122.1 MAG: hypothetical protein A3I37_04805 [Candidatus Uhrbacteria bacterium RIFCSPLOWO2_02_FULL_46_19]OGL90164.1 MAG: hypothetical protein A3H10_05205 [Candidatus Uhrbacteria bacterium RIFCSPLOWO2_12_FULL_46_10]